jgi:hypothetical protein
VDPDPAPDLVIFVLDLQDANEKVKDYLSFSAYYFLKEYLHYFSKGIKKPENSRNQGFSYSFCTMIEGSESGSVPLTNDSNTDPGGTKNMDLTDPDPQPQHCTEHSATVLLSNCT